MRSKAMLKADGSSARSPLSLSVSGSCLRTISASAILVEWFKRLLQSRDVVWALCGKVLCFRGIAIDVVEKLAVTTDDQLQWPDVPAS